MSALTKAKGFKKSKSGTYLSIGHHRVRRARCRQAGSRRPAPSKDTLRLIDAAVSAVAIVTGLAILYRELKRLGDDDVLLG